MKSADNLPQISLILRIGGGIYLLYLAWDLRHAAFTGSNGLLFGIAMIVFGIAGLVLTLHAGLSLFRRKKSD